MSAVPDPPGIDTGELDNGIASCRSDNPCEASWQTAYAYAADRAYRLAIFQAIQGVVFGALQYASADRTADLQYDIADRQMKIAEEEYARYKQHYAACEDALAAEICALTLPMVDYDTHADRALRDVRREFSSKRKALERSRMRYCMSDQLRATCELDRAEALAVVMARDMAYRYAEGRQDFFDDRRWQRRLNIVQQGRSIFSGQGAAFDSGAGYAINALDARQGALDNFLGTISGAIGGVANARSARSGAHFQNGFSPSPGVYSSYAAPGYSGGQPTGQGFIAGGGQSAAGLASGVSPMGRFGGTY